MGCVAADVDTLHDRAGAGIVYPLTDPVEEYRPEFADVPVLDGFDGDTPRLRPPATRATVHQLVTHTTGLGYWFINADIARWEQVTGNPNVMSGSNEIFNAPMVADPGTKFEYGINIDWLGQVVEAAADQALDKYMAENVTGPLGMDSTTWIMSPDQRANCIPIHVRGEDGAWVATDVDWCCRRRRGTIDELPQRSVCRRELSASASVQLVVEPGSDGGEHSGRLSSWVRRHRPQGRGIVGRSPPDQLGAKSPPIRSTHAERLRQTTERHEVHASLLRLPFEAEGSFV